MHSTTLVVVALATFIVSCNADIYLSNPRGSNNRLNENSAARKNANRVFDSQNNNRGGYNVGDRTDKAAGNNVNNQYQMEYFMSGLTPNDVTKLVIEWTNQHGCGGNEDDNPHKLNCDVIIQYKIENADNDQAYQGNAKYRFRDGTAVNTQGYTNIPEDNDDKAEGTRKFKETVAQYNNRKNGNVNPTHVYQEPHEWYDKCRARPRNNGLFLADQKPKENRATHTRQNPGGTRRGYECPEERDYFPYWHPTAWKDIMVYTKDKARCDFYKKESFNVKPKGECVEQWPGTKIDRHYSGAETPENCKKIKGEWIEFHNYLEIADLNEAECKGASSKKKPGFVYKWAIPYLHSATNRRASKCLVLLKAPDCDEAPFSRQNHLGNGADLEPLRHEWKLPSFPSLRAKKFIFRIRYNISTDDYDPHNTDSTSNENVDNNDATKDVQSPVTNNPLVDVGGLQSLQLAINTAQFGRTFEDRSHLSMFVPRPTGVSGVIHNLNVRGKRGNIVQTFPAVEYDFMPNDLSVSKSEHVHIQWTGSNTHNNGNSGGDGQTGDAGQGTGGTDRHNIVGLGVLDDNFPQVMEDDNNMCHHMEVVYEKQGNYLTSNKVKWYDICLKLGSGGYYDCKSGCPNALDTKAQMNNLLNNVPASFPGMLVKFKTSKTFFYTCTRNNAFTNRSQKGKITVA